MFSSPNPSHPAIPGPIQRPSLVLLGTEPWRAAFEFVSHKINRRRPGQRGDGHPVVIFPGLGADATSLAPLLKHCQTLGYTAFDWGRGFNTGPKGDVDQWLSDLAGHTAARLAGFDQKASLIGWSLGGLYAREIAKLLPPAVRQVITIGTPFNAGADYTHVGWIYRLLSGNGAKYDAALSQRLRTAPPVPTTSVYSRSDGVVAWQTCRHDVVSKRVEDIEVNGSHIGLGWNREVLGVVADRLAQRPGQWRPYAGIGPGAPHG